MSGIGKRSFVWRYLFKVPPTIRPEYGQAFIEEILTDPEMRGVVRAARLQLQEFLYREFPVAKWAWEEVPNPWSKAHKTVEWAKLLRVTTDEVGRVVHVNIHAGEPTPTSKGINFDAVADHFGGNRDTCGIPLLHNSKPAKDFKALVAGILPHTFAIADQLKLAETVNRVGTYVLNRWKAGNNPAFTVIPEEEGGVAERDRRWITPSGEFARIVIGGANHIADILLREAYLVRFKKSRQKIAARILRELIYESLDRDTLKLTLSLGGGQASVADYNLVRSHEEWFRAGQKLGNVVPRVWFFLLSMWEAEIRENVLDKVAVYQGQNRWGDIPVRPRVLPEDMYSTLKRRLLKWGCTPAGWKWLLKQKPAGVTYLLSRIAGRTGRGEVLSRLAVCLNVGAATGVGCVKSTLFKYWNPLLNPRLQQAPRNNLIAVTRAVYAWANRNTIIERAYTGNRTFRNKIQYITDWLGALRQELNRDQRNRPFEYFLGLADAWHADVWQVQIPTGEHRTWDTLIESWEDGDLTATALTDTTALVKEGKAMHHCVGSYSRQCAEGYARVFSITRKLKGKGKKKKGKKETNVEHVSTLELRATSSGWEVAQNYGPCNSGVDKEIQAFGREVAEQYNKAANKKLTEGLDLPKADDVPF